MIGLIARCRRTRQALAIGFAALVGGVAAVPEAQTPPAQAGAAEVAQAIAGARAAQAAGRPAEAMSILAAVLKKFPANADAARAQVDLQLDLQRLPDALATYDAYVAARRRPDPALLAVIGEADLRHTLQAKRDSLIFSARVWERLARHGDATALDALRRASAAQAAVSPEALAPTIALARLNDPAAAVTLAGLLRSAQPLERAQVIQAIGEAGLRQLAPRVTELLGDPDVNVRSAAATTLGMLQEAGAIPALRTAYDTDTPAVRLYAAVALKRLGQTTADAFLEGLLNGQIAELRVIAAGAYENAASKTLAWDQAMRALLGSDNPVHRLQAAELMLCCDVPAARMHLTSALASDNPLLRAGAAKIFEARRELADPVIARRILGDAVDGVRIYGAGLALDLARAAAAPGRSPAAAHSRTSTIR